MRNLAAALATLLALAACSPPPPEMRPALKHRNLAAIRLDPAEATAALNAYRRSLGLAPVTLDPSLVAFSQRQADAMAAAGQMSHDIAGNFTSRLAASGLRLSEAGENLGEGYASAGEALQGWRESPAHDENLRQPNMTRFGIAIAKNPDSPFGVYWAMVVAAPM